MFDERYDGKKIVTVGRLSIEKGQDLAIKVLSRLRREGYEFRWCCIGEGKHRKNFESLIAEHNLTNDFIFMGSTLNPYPYITRSNIHVQPSRHERYCLTLAEAICLNKPIIATNFLGAHEQIINGYNGLIVDFDEEKLANNLSQLKLVDTTKEVSKLLNYTS